MPTSQSLSPDGSHKRNSPQVRFACIDIKLALAHMVCHFQGVAHHDCCAANAENVRLDETMIIQ